GRSRCAPPDRPRRLPPRPPGAAGTALCAARPLRPGRGDGCPSHATTAFSVPDAISGGWRPAPRRRGRWGREPAATARGRDMAVAKNTICLWYDKDAEEAARFYA